MAPWLVIALALAGGGRFERVNSRTPQGRSERGLMSSSGAFFEFAPSSGAGMGTACACAPVTGAKGEAITFSRASVGSCIKGSTTSLQPGDMVICASGQPRVMPGGDGTGGLGLLTESAGSNVVTRSEELDDAAWADFIGTGGTAPTIDPDVEPAPDGTGSADMAYFEGTTGTQSSARSIAVLTAAAYSAQVYLRGVSGPGTTDLCIETSGGATCSACAFAATAWSPCKVENVTSVTGGRVFVGNLTSLNGGTERPGQFVFVWGTDAKAETSATSYVPTAGSAVARATETVRVALPLATPVGVCVSGTLVLTSTAKLIGGAGLYLPVLSQSTSIAPPYVWPYAGITGGNLSIDAAGAASSGYTTTTAAGLNSRYLVRHSGAWTLCKDGACSTGASTTWLASSFAYLLFSASVAQAAVWKDVQVDPSPTRCL